MIPSLLFAFEYFSQNLACWCYDFKLALDLEVLERKDSSCDLNSSSSSPHGKMKKNVFVSNYKMHLSKIEKKDLSNRKMYLEVLARKDGVVTLTPPPLLMAKFKMYLSQDIKCIV